MERAAFAFTRKLAYEPHRIGTADIERLSQHYKDLQALEIIFTVAGFASMNRWTETLGIPAEEEGSALMRFGGKAKGDYKTFATPTSDKYKALPSKVAPLATDAPKAGVCRAALASRPALESRAELEAALDACRKRAPRLPLIEETQVRPLLPADWSKEPLAQWVRLLANFPKAGRARILGLRAAEEHGKLDALLKAEIAWIAARHDRAWYALGQAKRRLAALGLSEDAIYALDGSWDRYAPSERAVFALVRKVTVAPASIVDEDVAELRKHYTDHQVAEVIYHITCAAFFDRVTEASGLQLEK